jgi:hypothetical protein
MLLLELLLHGKVCKNTVLICQALQASRRCCQRSATIAAYYNSELNVTTLQQGQKEYPTDGSHFSPCEWKADDPKSSTKPNRFGKTHAQMKQAITAAPPMNDNEKRILLAIAMQENDDLDSMETGESPEHFCKNSTSYI